MELLVITGCLLFLIVYYLRMVFSLIYIKGRISWRYWITTLLFPIDPFVAYCEEYKVFSAPMVFSAVFVFIALLLSPATHLILGINLVLPTGVLIVCLICLAIVFVTMLIATIGLANDLHISIIPLFLPLIGEIYLLICLTKEMGRKGLL